MSNTRFDCRHYSARFTMTQVGNAQASMRRLVVWMWVFATFTAGFLLLLITNWPLPMDTAILVVCAMVMCAFMVLFCGYGRRQDRQKLAALNQHLHDLHEHDPQNHK